MKWFLVKDHTGKTHQIRARDRLEAGRKLLALVPPPRLSPVQIANEMATEITITVSGAKASGKTFFVHRVLLRALAIAGLKAINVIEDETTVPSFDRVTVRIPLGRLKGTDSI